jgi:hypothetical protein
MTSPQLCPRTQWFAESYSALWSCREPWAPALLQIRRRPGGLGWNRALAAARPHRLAQRTRSRKLKSKVLQALAKSSDFLARVLEDLAARVEGNCLAARVAASTRMFVHGQRCSRVRPQTGSRCRRIATARNHGRVEAVRGRRHPLRVRPPGVGSSSSWHSLNGCRTFGWGAPACVAVVAGWPDQPSGRHLSRCLSRQLKRRHTGPKGHRVQRDTRGPASGLASTASA